MFLGSQIIFRTFNLVIRIPVTLQSAKIICIIYDNKQLYKWQSFSWAKWYACCKSHVWTILRVRFARVSKPLNWSSITTKCHKNNWTFFQNSFYLYKRKKFKIVYSTGCSQKNTETENWHEETRQNRSSALGGIRAVVISACDTLLTYTALFKDRKHKRRIERRVFYEQDLFGWIQLFMRVTNSTRR